MQLEQQLCGRLTCCTLPSQEWHWSSTTLISSGTFVPWRLPFINSKHEHPIYQSNYQYLVPINTSNKIHGLTFNDHVLHVHQLLLETLGVDQVVQQLVLQPAVRTSTLLLKHHSNKCPHETAWGIHGEEVSRLMWDTGQLLRRMNILHSSCMKINGGLVNLCHSSPLKLFRFWQIFH